MPPLTGDSRVCIISISGDLPRFPVIYYLFAPLAQEGCLHLQVIHVGVLSHIQIVYCSNTGFTGEL